MRLGESVGCQSIRGFADQRELVTSFVTFQAERKIDQDVEAAFLIQCESGKLLSEAPKTKCLSFVCCLSRLLAGNSKSFS